MAVECEDCGDYYQNCNCTVIHLDKEIRSLTAQLEVAKRALEVCKSSEPDGSDAYIEVVKALALFQKEGE